MAIASTTPIRARSRVLRATTSSVTGLLHIGASRVKSAFGHSYHASEAMSVTVGQVRSRTTPSRDHALQAAGGGPRLVTLACGVRIWLRCWSRRLRGYLGEGRKKRGHVGQRFEDELRQRFYADVHGPFEFGGGPRVLAIEGLRSTGWYWASIDSPNSSAHHIMRGELDPASATGLLSGSSSLNSTCAASGTGISHL